MSNNADHQEYIEYTLINLPYHPDLLQHYARLSSLPGFVFLDSSDASSNHGARIDIPRGRYDIVSACPYQRYVCLVDDDRETYITQLQQALKKKPPQNAPVDLPFQGGLIGYFSYDFGALRQGLAIPKQTVLNEGDKAQSCLADFGLYDWAIITDHHLKTVNLFAANHDPNTTPMLQEILARWQRQADLADNSLVGNGLSQVSMFTSLIDKETYTASFQQIHKALYEGRAYQVNYTQPFRASYKGNLWSLFTAIRATNPVPFSAYFSGVHQTILSCSPERFLACANGRLLTSPIKGSIRREADKILDQNLRHELLSSSKDRAENIMIVDLLRNDLSRISEKGSVQVKALCELETYRSVHHLVSTIVSVCRDDMNPIDAFLSCFPGGSITGAPKLEAMRIIYEQEKYARGAYCGSLAYFSSHGDFDSNLLIRTIVADAENLSLSVGGGIVIDSQCEEEYAECLFKIKSIKSAIQS